MVISTLVLVAVLVVVTGTPRMNDITTDLTHPPQFSSMDSEYPEAFKELMQKYYPKFDGLVVNKAASDTFQGVQDVIQKQTTWEVTKTDPEQKTIEAIAVSPLLKIKEDVVVRLTPISDQQTKIDIRSRSRFGDSDFGSNAKRILIFLSQCEDYFKK